MLSNLQGARDMIVVDNIQKALTANFPGEGPSLDSLLLYLTLSVVLFVVIYMIASR